MVLQSLRQSSHVAAKKEASVSLPLPLKSESHATRYRTSPTVPLTTLLSALGQMLDGLGREEDVELEVVVAVSVDDGVDVEAGAEVDDAGDMRTADDKVRGSWLAPLVLPGNWEVSIGVKGMLLVRYFRLRRSLPSAVFMLFGLACTLLNATPSPAPSPTTRMARADNAMVKKKMGLERPHILFLGAPGGLSLAGNF